MRAEKVLIKLFQKFAGFQRAEPFGGAGKALFAAALSTFKVQAAKSAAFCLQKTAAYVHGDIVHPLQVCGIANLAVLQDKTFF